MFRPLRPDVSRHPGVPSRKSALPVALGAVALGAYGYQYLVAGVWCLSPCLFFLSFFFRFSFVFLSFFSRFSFFFTIYV
jgi:hypothetical protein